MNAHLVTLCDVRELRLVVLDAAEEELTLNKAEPHVRAAIVELRQFEGGGHHGVEGVLGGLLASLGRHGGKCQKIGTGGATG